MSADTKLFQAPKYPKAPTTPPTNDRPKPIFPWESTAPKPTRVFADDLPTTSTPSVTTDDDTITETASPITPTARLSSPEPFAAYQSTNAWDEIPAIEHYVSNLPQNRRARVQLLSTDTTSSKSTDQGASTEAVISPGLEGPQGRRPSMKLTDFPTEIERPSLPVTPAPVRRPSFWGAERDEQGDLPGAEGVPTQSEWNPVARLKDLQRRQSEVLAQGPGNPQSKIPDRELPGSASIPLSEVKEEGGEKPAATQVDANMPPNFQTLDFTGNQPLDFSGGAGREEGGRSTETAPTDT